MTWMWQFKYVSRKKGYNNHIYWVSKDRFKTASTFTSSQKFLTPPLLKSEWMLSGQIFCQAITPSHSDNFQLSLKYFVKRWSSAALMCLTEGNTKELTEMMRLQLVWCLFRLIEHTVMWSWPGATHPSTVLNEWGKTIQINANTFSGRLMEEGILVPGKIFP